MGVSGRWERTRDTFAPWAGLVSAVIGGAFTHQVGSQSVFDECNSSPGLVIAVGIIGFAIAAAGAFESWGIFRADREGPARKVVAAVSLGTGAFVGFAIVLTIIASLVIPACFA